MLRAFQADPSAPLAERLLQALEAGLAAGGEHVPVRSAHLLVVEHESFPLVDLRVDWHDTPIAELRALWHLLCAAEQRLSAARARSGQSDDRLSLKSATCHRAVLRVNSARMARMQIISASRFWYRWYTPAA